MHFVVKGETAASPQSKKHVTDAMQLASSAPRPCKEKLFVVAV